MKFANKNKLKTGLLLIIILATSGIVWSQYLMAEQLTVAEKETIRLAEEFVIKKQAEEKALQDAKTKAYLMGKFDPGEKEDFLKIPSGHTNGAYVMYLRKETLGAFIEMAEAARKDGVRLIIASATRNFDYQRMIWNNKWRGITSVDGQNLSLTIPNSFERFKKILEYSAVPGTSRHHWGTDIDINNANTSYFYTAEGMIVYDWLEANASKFGFCQPYNLKNESRPTGFNEEKWHWSYLPLAKDFTQKYKEMVTEEEIKGFLGDANVPGSKVINDYVLGINPACL